MVQETEHTEAKACDSFLWPSTFCQQEVDFKGCTTLRRAYFPVLILDVVYIDKGKDWMCPRSAPPLPQESGRTVNKGVPSRSKISPIQVTFHTQGLGVFPVFDQWGFRTK